MFKITDTLATHGLGDQYYPHPKDKLRTGERMGFSGEWVIIDCRDLEDNWNPPIEYVKKIIDVEFFYHDYDDGSSKIVICCGAGISRSNAVALGYLFYTGKTWEEARKMVHSEGSIAQIENGHLIALKTLFGIKDTFQGKELK